MNVSIYPNNYFGLTNGFYYSSPKLYKDPVIEPWVPLYEINEDCFQVDPPLTDPPPMYGYDPRCRPWYTNTIKDK